MNNHAIGFGVSALLHGAIAFLVLTAAPSAPPPRERAVPVTLAMFEPAPAAPSEQPPQAPAAEVAPPNVTPERRPEPEPPQPRAEEPPPKAPPRLARTEPPRPKAKPKRPPPVATRPEPQTAPAPAAPPPPPETQSAPEPARTPPPDAEPPVARAEPAPPAPASAQPDPAALAHYAQALAGLIARHRAYPRQAQMRGWQGEVELALEIGADGRLRDAQVRRSSGFETLDRQALEMARRAHPLPPPPPELQRRDFVVLVPVVFRLES